MYAKITNLKDGNIALSTSGAKRIPLDGKDSSYEFGTVGEYKRFQTIIERYRIRQTIKLEILGKKEQENKPVPEKTKVVDKPMSTKKLQDPVKVENKPVPEKTKVVNKKDKKKKFF